jgi:predicted ABC-type transport system involved in lysophospholipase L1 biosynthesis ATPase subunit
VTQETTVSDPFSPPRPPDSDPRARTLLAVVALRDRLHDLRHELATTEDQFVAEIRALRDLRGSNSSRAT